MQQKVLTCMILKLKPEKCDAETGNIMLIDEISGGNMRVYKDGGQYRTN